MVDFKPATGRRDINGWSVKGIGIKSPMNCPFVAKSSLKVTGIFPDFRLYVPTMFEELGSGRNDCNDLPLEELFPMFIGEVGTP